MNRTLTALAIFVIATLGLASCGSSTADMQSDVRSALDDSGIALDDAGEKNIDAWTECMLQKVGLKRMRNAFSADGNEADLSDSDVDRMDNADERCVQDLGLNPDAPWEDA